MKTISDTGDGLVVDVQRKRVKHVNFTVYPPDGRVRVSAPLRMPDEALHMAIRSKLPWIKRHQARDPEDEGDWQQTYAGSNFRPTLPFVKISNIALCVLNTEP